MITIKHIENNNYEDAMRLKIDCWSDELAGIATNTLILANEMGRWKKWMDEASLYNDKRITLCAFDGDELVGVVAASFSDEDGIENAIELNGLWVNNLYRGKNISIILLSNIINEFKENNINKIIVYNLHTSPSNSYYRKLGFSVLRQVIQKVNDVSLEVDLFYTHIETLNQIINKYNL